jgi:predicted ATPase
VPCVRRLCEEELVFDAPVTMLVGENGSGKSTLVEAIAGAYGLDVEGGHGNRKFALNTGPGVLGGVLELRRPSLRRVSAKEGSGFFLRSETAYDVFEKMSGYKVRGYEETMTSSHGEGYLQVLGDRFNEPGLYLLDEPEAPLSFDSCLMLVRILHEAVKVNSQVICATHSPLLAAIPGARIIEIGEHGMRPVEWEDLEMVKHWRRYLSDPSLYLKYLLND